MATFSLDDLETSHGTHTEPPVLYTDFPDLIDNTAREQFRTCPRKFQLSTINKITPIRKSIHLHAGGAYAAGLEALRKAYYDQGLSESDALAVGVETLIKFYGDYEPLETDLKTCDRMVGALVSYTDQYPLATDYFRPMKIAPNKSAVEFTFAIPIPETTHPVLDQPLLYAGRFDMLAEKDGVLFVEDDKTTSQLGPTWGSQWELNSQFTGYVWAAKTFDFPVAGAVIRGQSILKHTYGHAQAVTYRPQWQINRWYAQLVRDIHGMIKCWKEDYFDFALGGACTQYGGCEFRSLCTAKNPEEWIPGHFTQRHWNPTAKDPEAKENPPAPDGLTSTIAEETYTCPIHGHQDGPACPRC